MLEVLKLVANWGFPAFLCIYLLWSYGKKLDKLDNTIGNHLTHALEENTDATKKVGKSMDNLSEKIIRSLDKK